MTKTENRMTIKRLVAMLLTVAMILGSAPVSDRHAAAAEEAVQTAAELQQLTEEPAEGEEPTEEVSSEEEAPAEEEPAAEDEEAAAEEEPSEEAETPTEEEPAEAAEAPAEEEPAEAELPAEEVPADEAEVPAEEEPAEAAEAPAEEEPSEAAEAPAEEESAEAAEAPAEEVPVEEEPAAEEISAVEEPAVTEETPATEAPIVTEETTAAEEPAVTEETPAEEEPAVTEETPAEEEPAVTEETPAAEEPAVTEESPAEEEPAAEETPVAEEPVEAEETPAAEEPAAEETPVAEEPVEAEETPAEEEPAVTEETPAEEEPAAEETPVEEEPAVTEETPAKEEPAAEEIPVEEEPVVTEEIPAEEEPVVTDETPAEEEPAAEETPVEEEPVVTEEIPAEEAEEPVAEETPVEEEPVVTEETPAEEAPAVEEIPVEEEPIVIEGTPVEEEPAVTEEIPAAEEPAVTEEIPAAEEPIVMEETPAAEAPAAEETPVEEEPAVTEEIPAAEEPAAEEAPAEEEPVVEEEPAVIIEETPAAEEPAAEEAPAEEPVVIEEIPAAEEPAAAEAAPAAGWFSVSGEAAAPTEAPAEEAPAAQEVSGETTAAPEEEAAEPEEEEVGLYVLAAGDETVEDPAAALVIGEPRTLELEVDDYIVSAYGAFPVGTELQVVAIPQDTAQKMTSKNLLFAYDIRLVVNGQVWQPDESSIQITVRYKNADMSGRAVRILHVKTDFLDAEGNLSEEAVDRALQGVSDGSVETETIGTDTEDDTTAFETTSFSGFIATTVSKLQDLFDKAVSEQGDNLNEKIQITLNKDTTYEGDVDLSVGDRTVGENFSVELMAEDAGEDGLQADGSTVVAGNVTIKGIAVRLMGLVLGAGNKISAEKAKLDILGTKANDVLDISVLDADSTVTVNTGAGDDAVTAENNGGTVTVETGAGNDKVTATNNSGEMTVNTGEGDDAVTAENKGGKTTIDTGDGEDSVTAKLSRGQMDISTGAGADKAALTYNAPDGELTVSTGDGDDAVQADVQSAGKKIEISTGAGDDSVTLTNTNTVAAAAPAGDVSVDLGAGVNDMSVSLSLANAMPKLSVKGTDGNDHLHITGELGDGDDRAAGTAASMSLKNASGKVLNIVTEAVESITDDLENKKTVTLTPSQTGSLTFAQAESFTNYIINAPSSTLKDIIVHSPLENGAYKETVLSNVIIDTDTFTNSDNALKIGQGSTIDTRGLKLVLKARNIDVAGTLKADLVQLEALDGTGMYSRNFKEYLEGYAERENIVVASFDAATNYLWDMVNIKDKATVHIAPTGKVYSAGDVIMLARVEQSGTLISTVPINAVNVKVGEAAVNIEGTVQAGVEFDENGEPGRFNSGHGSVRADAQVKTSTGLDKDGKEMDAYPIGVTVAYGDAAVNVAKNATVDAAGSISLASKSEIDAVTKSESGLFGAPASIAVGVLLNNAETTVDGTLNAHHGDVRVEANADMNAKTKAEKGAGQEIKSGGYVAVSVALQDAIAKVAGTVTAGGKADVNARASEKVENTATSAEEEKKDGDGKTAEEKLEDAVWTGIREIFGTYITAILQETANGAKKAKEAEKKMGSDKEKAGKSTSFNAQLDDNAQKKGEVSMEEDDTGDLVVIVKPWDGYKVSRVYARGFNPGSNKYLECPVAEGEYGIYTVTPESDSTKVSNVFVFVEYEEDESAEEPTAADLFDERPENNDDDEVDIQQMLEDLENSTDEDEELERELQELEVEDLATFVLPVTIITYDLEEDDDDDLACRINYLKGDKVRLIPNPPAGSQLKSDSLKVEYTVKDDKGKESRKTVDVKADSKGRYYFTVPDEAELGDDHKFVVKAEFEEKKEEKGKEGDEDQTEAVGAIAVVVADNDSQALIDEAAKVTSGKKTGVSSEVVTDVTNTADGSTVGKKEAAPGEDSKAKAEEGKAIERPASTDYSEAADPMKYGLIVDETVNGKVAYAKGSGNYQYEFTPSTTAEGYSVARVLLVYTSGGEQKTKELTASGGKYAVDLADSSLKMDAGTTARLNVAFAKEGVYGEVVENAGQGTQVVRAHTVKVSYNKQKDASMGTITCTNAAEGVYTFTATPASSYILDGGKLTASWTDASGAAQTKDLEKSDGSWKLDACAIPAGTTITVSGKFVDDLRAIKTETEGGEVKDGNGVKAGTIKLYDEKVKLKDKPQISVKAEAGYKLTDITVTYKAADGSTKKLTLSGDDKKVTKVSGKENIYTFEIADAVAASADVKVNASFERKLIGLHYDGMSGTDVPKDYKLSEVNVAPKDKVTVTLSDDKVKAGYKVTKITVTNGSTEVVSVVNKTAFDIPEDTENSADTSLNVKVETALKEVELKETKLTNGTLTPAVARADSNETVTVTVKPNKDFKVKKNTLKATFTIQKKDETGTRTEEVTLVRQNDTTYTLQMPNWDSTEKATAVSFTGEFEPGQNDSTAMETSMGAAIAVTVANSESRGEIRGGVTAGGAVDIGSKASGGVKTETKAGYSKGNIGIGGAVSVQVASLDSKALLHNSSDVKLDGKLGVNASSDVAFEVNADATGSKQAAKTGVGAGIAVAVNGSDAIAGIQDNTKLSKNQKDAIKGISVTSNAKVKDTVAAKAGTSGGNAVAPVVAVDVSAANAEAYMGKVSGSDLTLTEDMAVSAGTDAKHTISADASATGKGVGVGASIVVSVLFDDSSAKLNQSVKADNVTVASETVSNVKSTATAGASGGKKDKESKSPDKQADGLLNGAANLAGKNGSSKISGGKIDAVTKNRQKAETDEGTVGVAGAIVVNVQESESIAEVADGVHINAAGNAAVTALNGTTSVIKANASTTNSDVGVGVGAAVNVVFLDNIARVGNGDIEAGNLKVAATTKITEPAAKEETKKDEKVQDKDGLAVQLGEKVGGWVNDLAKSIGLTSFIPGDLLGRIVDPVVRDAVNELIKATGLGDVLGTGDFDDKVSKAKKLLEDAKDGLLAMPELLVKPMLALVDDEIELDSLTPEQLAEFTDTLLEEFKASLLEEIGNAGENILTGVKDGIVSYLGDSVADILGGVLSDGGEEAIGNLTDKAREIIIDEVKDETRALTTGAFAKALENTARKTGTTLSSMEGVYRSINNIRDVYKKETLDSIYTKATEYAAKTFKENVFDYEAMIQKVSKTDFKKVITDGLKNAAKAANITLGNEIISSLSDHFGLSLEPEEEKATGHVISTQGIAGAGARDVGVAGSVAITVLNSDTSATIADGGSITVGQAMTVDADEVLSIKNVGSAAVDAKGNADSNKNAAKKEEKDVGGGNDAGTKITWNKVAMESAPGASLAIRESDKSRVRPKIFITPKEGYKLPDTVKYTYKDEGGDEVTGTCDIKKDDNGNLYVDAMVGDFASLDDDVEVHLELTPEEVARTLPTPEAFALEDIDVKDALSVEVKGREPEKDSSGKEIVKAHAGETVQLHVKKAAGRKATVIGYSWTDAEGKRHDVELNSQDAAAGKEKAFTLVSSTKDEYIYSFTMPDGEISDIAVQFEKGDEPDAQESETASKDEHGKGVGVGAAFSMVYGGNDVTAKVGKRTVTAGELSIAALADHKEDISSVAGSDPVGSNTDEESIKKTSVDASIALNILDMDVAAGIASGSAVKTTGYGSGDDKKDGDLTISAKENAVTETTSSAYAVGGMTAVGATVSLNIALTSAKAEMAGSATVAGDATIAAASHSEDTTKALATAMGADIARNLNKLNKKTENFEEAGNKLLDGSYVDEIGKKKEEEKKDGDKKEEKKGKTDTGAMINERMDAQSEKTEDGKKTVAENSTSGNAARSVGAKAQTEDAGKEGTDKATDFINDKTGTDLGTGEKKESKPWQVAAAIGVTIASHDVRTTVGKITADGAISTTAENTGNFNTLGTGSAMSQAKKSNSIAAGIAVSVNFNNAKVSVSDDLVAGGDLTVASTLTQNRDDGFLSKLAAQSLAGSVAGKDSSVSIGGAISFVYSGAESTVEIAGGKADAQRKLEGTDITVEATDDSRLTSRAGGLSLSKGSSVGMGIASSNVVSKNTVKAAVGEETSISGDSFKLNAEKKAVSYYADGLNLRGLVSDSSKLSDEQRDNAETGLIDLHKGNDDKSYKIKVNLSTDKLLQAAEVLNVLAGQNTYVEAIAGSVMTGTSSGDDKSSGDDNKSALSLAGSFAVAVTNNTIAATLGKNSKVTLKKDMTLNAENGATTRIIAGSMSAGPAKNSVGATVSVLVTDDDVKAETGADTTITTDAGVSHTAKTKSDIQLFTAAIAVAAGDKVSGAAGGALNVIVSRNKAESSVGGGTTISAGGDVKIDSNTEQDLMAISGSGNVTAGKSKEGSTYAAGGTINVIYDRSQSFTKLGDSAAITAAKNLSVKSDVQDQLISGTATLSAAASKEGKAGAGVINFIWSESEAETKAGSAKLTGTAGDVEVNANNDAWMLNATLSVAGAAESALGAGFNVNVFNRKAKTDMTSGTVTAGRDLKIQSSGRDTSILAGLGASGGVKGSSLSGTVVFLWEGNEIGTTVSDGITATAGRNAVLESYFSDFTVGAAGNIAISGKGSAYGVTSVTAIKNNTVQTVLGTSDVTAEAGGDSGRTKTLTGQEIRGVHIDADAHETQFLAGAGIAASKDTSANGTVVVLANNNIVSADASSTNLKAEKNNGNITVTAADDTKQTLLAGGLNLSVSGSALGAAVVTLVSNKDVEALAHDMHANKDVNVSAENRDKMSTLAVSVGGSGSGTAIELGVALQVLKSRANAKVGSTVTADTGDFNLGSVNDTTLINAAGAIAASGGGAAMTPVGAITYFQGESNAVVKAGTEINVKQGDINITTESNKDVNLYTLGISAGSGFGLSGAANILVSKDKAYAGTEHIAPEKLDTAAKSTLTATAGNVNVKANSDYRLRAISGAAAVSASSAAVGVNAVVSVLKSNATSELSGEIDAGRDVNVTSKANRDVINAAATLGAGQAAGGITVMVLVAGTKMSQDAADMVAYGNSDSRESKDGFDAAKFMENAEKAGIDLKTVNGDEAEDDEDRQVSGKILAADLEGNGHKESDQAVGSTDGETSTFDGASGYRSDEIDTKANDTEDKDNRGESMQAEDTKDVANAKAVNTYTYTDDPDDAVIARIMGGSSVSAEGVNVTASQGVAADLIGAAIGVGSNAGMGVSTVVAIMRSNVLASSDAHIKKAPNGVNIKAESKSGSFFRDGDADDRNDTVLDLLSNKSTVEPGEDATEKEKKEYEEQKKKEAEEKKSTLEELKEKFGSRNIRAFSVALGVGQVGLAVSVAVVLTDNVTQAILGGKVEDAGNVNVESTHNYGSVMAATGAVAGGLAAVGASVAVAQANGTVRSLIRDGASVETNTDKDIKITTDSNVGVDSAAVTVGLGGYAAVNAGLALSINRLKQETGIGAGTTINSGRDITIDSKSDTTANSYLLGVSVAGYGAVLVNAGVSDVAADINTHIGGESAASDITATRNISVTNTTISSAVPKALAVAAGGVAVGGNVLLAFNDTKATAAVSNAKVKAVDMIVSGDIAGDATSDLTALTIGAIAVGISVNYADMRADNRASVTDSDIDLSGSLKILTGSGKNNKTTAEAHTISGNVGLISVGMNAAIARNNTKNYAILEGAKPVKVGKDLTVHGAGKSTAIADMTGFDLGALSVAVSAVVALNDADARTQVEVNNDVTVTGTAAFNSTQDATTTAKLWTGGGSLISAKVSAAMAYGRANALVNVTLHGDKADLGALTSKIEAGDQTTATIDNMSFDLVSAAARFAGAYSQDVFQSKVIMSSTTTEIHGDTSVTTDYTIGSNAIVTPSTSGVDVSLASVAINASIAKNTAGAAAYFESVKGDTTIDGNLNVLATGNVATNAEVKTATISASLASLGANIAKSDLSARQAAYLRVGKSLTVTGSADIQSIAKNAVATSEIGPSGGDAGLDLSLANLDVSRSIARENMDSTAAVLGGPVAEAEEKYYIDEGKYVTKHKGYFDYELKLSGYHIQRDENGVAAKERVTWIYYDTGESEMLNSAGVSVIQNFEEQYDGIRKEEYRTKTVGDKWVYSEEYFEWIEEDVTEWEENRVEYKRKVDVYNPEENVLSAAALSIISENAKGTKTGATASTQGAEKISLATAGSLDAQAYSTDSFGVLFEGMTAEITGKAVLRAGTQTESKAKGSMPGSLSLVDAAGSDVRAQVGRRDDRQTVSIVIGQGNSLIAGDISITANNTGAAEAALSQGTSFSLGKVKKTTQPTESYYNTLISVGRNATLKATSGDIKISSNDTPTATSNVKSTNVGLLLNFNSMMGKNSIDQENNLDIGSGANVTAKKNVNIEVDQHTIATAQTIMSGGGILDGTTAKAQNTILRVARINVGSDATIKAEDGDLLVKTVSGANDDIYSKADASAAGLATMANAKAYVDLATYAEINVNQGASMTSKGKLDLDSRATSYNSYTKDKDGKVIGAGTRSEAIVDAAGLVPLPQTVAKNTLLFQSYINVNKRPDGAETVARRKTTLESEDKDVNVIASNEGLVLYTRTHSSGKGLAGTSNAASWNSATLTNAIWIDDANLTGNSVRIYADNGSNLKNNSTDNKYKVHIVSDAYAKLAGIGSVKPESRITGEMINQIRSHNTASVAFTARNGKVVHKFAVPTDAIWQEARVDAEVKKVLGIPLASTKKKTVLEWYYFNRCDFCGEGTEYDVDATAQKSMDARYEDAFKKVLSPINDIQRMVDSLGSITKARYGEEDYTTASKKFVLDIQSILEKDVRLSPEQTRAYRLWTNMQTYLNVYLLPNATRLYMSGANRLQYVVDVINGDLFGEGGNQDIELITALTRNAFANPVIPVGSTGSLNLKTGLFTLPDQADYELYLHEVSGSWLLENMRNGFMRTLVADPESVNACALEGHDLPEGAIEEKLTEGEQLTFEGMENYTLYWIGETPETAADPDQVLIGLLFNEETDEIDAFRTTMNMLADNELTDVSLYMYRDSKADRMGEEKYNVMFFDTPENEYSLVKAVTSVLAERKLETPLSLKIILRGRHLEGADLPVYTLTDHAFILFDGTDGEADALGGYHVTFDGDTFDSNYTLIEGISDGNITVTIKKGQPVWPEWTDDQHAEDIEGTQFELVDGEWEEIPENTTMQADAEGDNAA